MSSREPWKWCVSIIINKEVNKHALTPLNSLFLTPGSQFQLAAGQIICFVQVAVHVRTMPFSTPEKNLLQFIGMAVSALIAFVGLVLNYLNVSRDYARLGGQVFQVKRLTWQIDVVKGALSIITIGGIVLAIVIQAAKTGLKAYQGRSKIASNFTSAKRMAANGVRRARRFSSSFGGSTNVQLELPELQSSPAEPVPSLDRIDRRGRLARLSMDASEAVSAGGAGAVNMPGEGEQVISSGGEDNATCKRNPLNGVHVQPASMESKIVDSGLGDVDGPLAARSKSERFKLMRRFNREKSGDETVPVAMRPRNDSTPL